MLPHVVVQGDKLRLNQVLINLLGNAVKFTPKGGHIDFLVESLLHQEKAIVLRFAVADDGIGMTAVQVERLFHAFEQADESISTRFGGTGLWLTISQHLVEQMGGRITVESELGKGSRFAFTLTMDIATETASEEISGGEGALVLEGKTLLLVEDVEINRQIVQELLSDTGVTIEEAVNGREALRMFEASPVGHYQLIFMDIQMPEMNGYEATLRIRALSRPDAATVPIIAMTANAYQEDIRRVLEAGMNGHLSKPIDIDQVRGTLRKYLLEGG